MPFNKKLLFTYFKLVLNIGLLLISFAICFMFLIPDNPAFKSIPISLMKTLFWLLGDLGYDDTFLPEKPLNYSVLSNILFVVFILGIGSIAFNLLTRDSAEAIDSIKQKSSFYQANATLSIHLLLDDCFPSQRRKYAVIAKDTTNRTRLGLNLCEYVLYGSRTK